MLSYLYSGLVFILEFDSIRVSSYIVNKIEVNECYIDLKL